MTVPTKKAVTVEDRDILPDHVAPVHYDLIIRPDMTTFKFNGQVRIK